MKRKLDDNAKSITIRYNKGRSELYRKKMLEYNSLVQSTSSKIAKILKEHRLTRNPEVELKDAFEDFKDEEQKIKNPLNVLIIRKFSKLCLSGEVQFLKNEYWYFPSGSLPFIQHTYRQELAAQRNDLDYLRSYNGRVVSENDIENLPVDRTETCEIIIYEQES